MRPRLMYLSLFCALSACVAALAQAPATTPPAKKSDGPATGPNKPRFAPTYKVYRTIEGQPLDGSPLEKKDNKPLFPEQTRAAGVLRILWPNPAGGFSETFSVEASEGTDGIRLLDYVIDADVAGEGLLVSYWTE